MGAGEAVKRIGLVAGPAMALAAYLLLPAQYQNVAGDTVAFTPAGRITLAMMAWMAAWWLTEAIDISATALLPLAAFPLLGILPIGKTAAPYGSDLIFLFMGGFLLALSMQRWGLDRRIALITLRLVGTRPPAMIGGCMLATAVLSMWVSNTATAAMMLPIALSVVDLVMKSNVQIDEGSKGQRTESGAMVGDGASLLGAGEPGRNFALSLMLGIAYAASIGGIGTIIGSPPNGILVEFVKNTYGREISFAQWMLIGGPFVLVFLPIAWVIITWVLYPIGIRRIEGGHEMIVREFRALGPMKAGEWATFIVFMCTACLWTTRPWLTAIELGTGEDAWRPLAGLSDAGIAMMAGLALFVIPVDRKRMIFAMDWPTAVRMPWGVLILFGGGLSLAAAVQANGVAEFFGSMAAALGGAPAIILVMAVTTGVIFLTELTSNTATTAALVPILAGMAPGLGVQPELLIIPATIAASCAFMMPVATPPNAMVFASGHVTIPQMAKAGLWLNLIGIGIITAIAYGLVVPLLLCTP